MELINTTCADVAIDTTTVDGSRVEKGARVQAKLTFAVAADGTVELVDDDPVPILSDDVDTPFGVLPSDTAGFLHDGVEIIVNGMAWAPGGKPVTHMEATLSIGSAVHRTIVVGDRFWSARGPDARPSEPIPFVRMPMTYE